MPRIAKYHWQFSPPCECPVMPFGVKWFRDQPEAQAHLDVNGEVSREFALELMNRFNQQLGRYRYWIEG